MTTKQEQQKQGKKDRIAGKAFEVKVRADLEMMEWIVDRWTNNVSNVFEQDIGEYVRKLIPAKPSIRFSKLGPILVNAHTGFPDFVCSTPELDALDEVCGYDIIGVESKMTGKLDKLEKEKCEWLLEKKIFRKILIASKGEKRGKIIYKEFKK